MNKEQWTDQDQDIVDAIMYGDEVEAEILMELRRLGVQNDSQPDVCPKCGAELEAGSGYVGETILYCPNGHGVFWEDSEDAIRRVY